MKLRGLTKLALSGVALAAVAATLGTSTYAWYVTNSTATASGVKGATTAGGLGNVLVAQKATDDETPVNAHGGFQQNITMNDGSFNKVLTRSSGLTPVSPQVYTEASGDTPASYTAATTIDSTTKWYTAKGAQDQTGNYLQFDLWILSTDKTKIKFEFEIENTTAANEYTSQIAYAATGLPKVSSAANAADVKQGESFTKNIVDSLRMAYTQTDYTSATNAETGAVTYTAGQPKSTVILNVAGSAKTTTATVSDKVFAAGGNAHNYYNAVLGEYPTLKDELAGTSNSAPTITVVKGEETKLSFYVWVEGTDTDCFDSIAGQTFSMAFSFTALEDNQ